MNTHVNLQPPAGPIRSDSKISPRWSPQVHYFFWDMSPMNSHPHLSHITALPLDFSWSFTALGVKGTTSTLTFKMAEDRRSNGAEKADLSVKYETEC